MFQIDIDCKDHDAKEYPAAPMLGGELQIGDESFSIIFLVDTGADSHLIDTATLPGIPRTLRDAPQTVSGGIGGSWRSFVPQEKISLAVMAIDTATNEPHAIDIPMNHVQFMAPYLQIDKRTHTTRGLLQLPPQDQRKRMQRRYAYKPCPPAFNLLGRNVFVENQLKLVFDPHGESHILTRPESGLAEILPQQPRDQADET